MFHNAISLSINFTVRKERNELKLVQVCEDVLSNYQCFYFYLIEGTTEHVKALTLNFSTKTKWVHKIK